MVVFFKSQNVVPKLKRFILPAPGFFRYLPHVYFRTKQIKGTPLLQLVEAYRNTQGQPRQRVVASRGGDTLPAGDPHLLAKAVEDEMNGQAGLLDEALTAEAAAWVAHVAKLAKRSKGATKAIGGTVLDGVLLDDMETEQIVELGYSLAIRNSGYESSAAPSAINPMVRLAALTLREREVHRWLRQGKRDLEIAILLGIRRRTIHHHVARVLRKLEVDTRSAAALY